MLCERHGDALERRAGTAIAERLRPGRQETAIGGPQRGDSHSGAGQHRDPAAIRAEPRPARAAKRKHGRLRSVGDDVAVGPGESERAVLPSDEAVTHCEGDALALQPAQPCAQQRRRFHRLGKHPATAADESLLSQRLAPGTHAPRRKHFDRGTQLFVRRAVAAQEVLQRFAVGEIEPAATGQQELASHRRHAVVDGDGYPGAGEPLGRHQAGGAPADHCHPSHGRARRGGELKSAAINFATAARRRSRRMPSIRCRAVRGTAQ